MQSELCPATDTGEAELDAICAVPGVDAVITGHSHKGVARLDHGVPIVQALQNGRGLAQLSIVFDERGGFTITPSVDELYRTQATLAVNADAQDILDRYQIKEDKQLKEPVVTLTADLPHARHQHVTPMGKWVCDTMKAKYGVEVVLMHGGGMRKGFVAGPVLEQDFWDLMPFDQSTVIFSISGAALKQAIASGIDNPRFGDVQWSGVRVVYDPGKTGAAAIISLTLGNGTPIEDGQIVRCATNDFQFDGGDCYTMLKASAKEVTRTYQPVREMLIAAARAQGTIVPPSVAGLVTAQPSH
jgi:2',3'-cyclic-nucleotide 2'-phosphodiesterase (5'-nucleotidase family)